ncbi:14559_t:CDS:2, partial [Racocetra fulgida]
PRYNNVLPPPNPTSNNNIHPPHLPPLNLPKKLENQPQSHTSSTSSSPEPTSHCHQVQPSENNNDEDNETKRVKTLEEKRAIRLERNRIAAKECRERKKAYVLNLERRATQMEKENSVLRKRVHELKAQLEWAESKTVGPVENGQLEALVRELKERVKKMENGEDSNIVFGKMEVEELVEEWQPEPLVPTITENQRVELEKFPILNG